MRKFIGHHFNGTACGGPIGRHLRWAGAKIARVFIREANRRRNGAHWLPAAHLYRLALLLNPRRHDIAIQAGNCFKEAGRYDLALESYDRATDVATHAEAAFQKGDALARGGAAAEAIEALEISIALGHPRAGARLSEISQFGLIGDPGDMAKRLAPRDALTRRRLLARLTRDPGSNRRWLGTLDRASHGRQAGKGIFWRDHIAFTQVGWLRITSKGRSEPVLAGVVAVRARIVSSTTVDKVELSIASKAAAEAVPSLVKTDASGRRLYSVNVWIDSAAFPIGRHALTMTALSGGAAPQTIRTIANVVRVPDDLELDESDSFVPSIEPIRSGDVAAAVSARPAKAHFAPRTIISEPVRTVLAMRVDQLGDVSASLPALQRLRALFPAARITALVAPGLIEIVEATGLCDEVLGLSVSYDHATEKRYLERGEEKRVKAVLNKRPFDIAIDLCTGDETRPLLKLVDANYLIGFNPRNFDYLDFGIDVISRDKVNRISKMSHAASVSMLIRCLEEALAPDRPPVLRKREDQLFLQDIGVTSGGYVVIHAGARHELNRWPLPCYMELAQRVLDATTLSVVMFTDDPVSEEERGRLRGADRVIFMGKTTMARFDAVLSHAAVMIGNDSGPKHLAAARGVQTVSIHVNRLNWNEWGQDSRGLIITKPVPCAGCGLNDIAMCAKDVLCLRSITVGDVSEVVLDVLKPFSAASSMKSDEGRVA